MSVWADIDKLKAKHDAEMTAATNGCEGEGAIKGSVTCDEFGYWHCRYVPCGERKHERLQAKSGPALVAAMKAVRAKKSPPRAMPTP